MGAALVSPAQPALSGDPRPTGDEPPLGGYAALATVFVASIAAVLSALASERRLPKDVSTRDLVLTGVATSRLARVLTRDRVAMPLRAPFAEYTGPGGPGEVHERPRGRGLQRAIGSLLTCPFCAAPWIAAGALVALELRPRVTRFVRGIFVSVTVADFVQQLYVAARTLDGHRR
ncbi:MAG: DUF1360 domain-containing protein [Polyangiaceae bacterium]|nr:DUF1360 domain-containing protein [Polyangiaceae bacterium]